MYLIITDTVDEAIQSKVRQYIDIMYPGISLKKRDRKELLVPTEDSKVIVLNEANKVSINYLKKVRKYHPNLDKMIYLVSADKLEDATNEYESVAIVMEDSISGVENGLSAFVVDDNELLPMETTVEETDSNSQQDLIEDELYIIEEPNNEGNSFIEENPNGIQFEIDEPIIEETTVGDNNQFEIDDPILEETSINEEANDNEPIIEETLLGSHSIEGEPTFEEPPIEGITTVEPNENAVIIDQQELMEEVPPKPSEKVIDKEEEKGKTREVFEEKIIALRTGVNIPVWKKKQVTAKTIGIWSPLHRIGATTFTMNFALYLASLSIPIAVLEGITKDIKMLSLLEVYSKRSRQWASYNSYLTESNLKAEQSIWSYQNANFFPLDERDIIANWSNDKIYYYMNGLKFHDVVLVDLPTGEMAPYTVESLKHIDELWVIINNDLLSLMEWKGYLQTQLFPRVEMKAIFLDEYEGISKPKKVASQLDLPLITGVPTLQSEILKNYFETSALIQQEGVREKVEPSFLAILENLAGDSYKTGALKVQVPQQEEGLLNRLSKKLKRW